MTNSLTVKDWKKFQHYIPKNGSKIVWIKLYSSLLDDYEFHSLPVEARALLPMLWLIASEKDGNLPDLQKIAFRLRMSEKDVIYAIKPLINNGSIISIESLYTDSRAEEKRGEDIEERREEKNLGVFDSEFEFIWKIFPNTAKKGSKIEALKKYVKIRNKGENYETIIRGVERYRDYCSSGTFNQHVITWFNQSGWLDEWETSHKPAGRDNQGQKQSYMDRIKNAASIACEQISRELDAGDQGDEKFYPPDQDTGRISSRISYQPTGNNDSLARNQDCDLREEGDDLI